MLSYNEIVRRIKENKKEIQIRVETGIVFYDNLQKILKISIDGDKEARAIQEVFGLEFASAYEMPIDGKYWEYGAIITNENLWKYKDEFIETHYK